MSSLVYATPLDSAPAHLPVIPGNMDRLLNEHLARLRGSWRNENYQQSRAANEVSTGVDRQWLTLRQAEERATDRRNQQLLREHHSYQQQLVRELAHTSSHQQRHYPPALAPRPSLTPAPLIMRAATRICPNPNVSVLELQGILGSTGSCSPRQQALSVARQHMHGDAPRTDVEIFRILHTLGAALGASRTEASTIKARHD